MKAMCWGLLNRVLDGFMKNTKFGLHPRFEQYILDCRLVLERWYWRGVPHDPDWTFFKGGEANANGNHPGAVVPTLPQVRAYEEGGVTRYYVQFYEHRPERAPHARYTVEHDGIAARADYRGCFLCCAFINVLLRRCD